MTKQERELLTEKMLTDASALDDREIDEIIADDELRLLFDAALQVRAATALKDYDSDKEWKAFSAKTIRRPRLRLMRWAASAAAILALAALGLSYWRAADAGNAASESPLTAYVDSISMEADDDLALPEQSAQDVAPDLMAQATPRLPETPKISPHKKSAPKKTDNAELLERMIIEQARIENEVAMAMAQTYIAESYVEYLYESDGCFDDFTMTDELISITAQ